jgi:hypothetical protein
VDTHTCAVVVSGDDFDEQDLTANGGASVTYQVDLTPYIDSISPRYGSVEGNTLVTFTGDNFSTSTSDYTILIDEIECDIQSASTTEVTCLTRERLGAFELDPQLSIYVTGEGYVATQGHVFRYVSLWSSDSTWGGLFAPIEGESVAVPKGTNLLVDVQNPPVLNLIVVDGGSLIFPSNDDEDYEATFDANYIFLNN